MNVREALTQAGNAVLIDVEVVPGSSQDRFPSGYNPWRKRLQARVQAPAQDGKANDALLGLVARFLGVSQNTVSLDSGATNRQKRIRVIGVDLEATLDALERALA